MMTYMHPDETVSYRFGEIARQGTAPPEAGEIAVLHHWLWEQDIEPYIVAKARQCMRDLKPYPHEGEFYRIVYCDDDAGAFAIKGVEWQARSH